jgi:hypothetical protein
MFEPFLNELKWRNGWFMDLTFDAIAKHQSDPSPKHTEIIAAQNLFYKAKKDWVERTRIDNERIIRQFQMKRELADAQPAERFEVSQSQDDSLYPSISPTIRKKRPEIIELAAKLAKKRDS